jgi:hypothetical protein
MSTVYELRNGQTVTFKLHTKLLPDIYSRVTVLGVVAHSLAAAMSGDDVDAIHSNIYSTLPSGTPKNATDYDYLIVRTATGERKAVGVPWIIEPVTVVDQQGLRIIIPKASSADAEMIVRDLNSRGITDFSIETI